MTTVLQDVKARMQELLEAREEQLQEIREQKNIAQAQKEAAALALRKATQEMNLEAYEEGLKDQQKAQIAIDMCTERYRQLQAQEMISEEESDQIIDSLLNYEKQLEEGFLQAAGQQLEEVKKILDKYQHAVLDTEQTIKAWGANIHANYQTRGLTSYIDPKTGQRSYRSPAPVPVHRGQFEGCKEAVQLRDYLKDAKGLIKIYD